MGCRIHGKDNTVGNTSPGVLLVAARTRRPCTSSTKAVQHITASPPHSQSSAASERRSSSLPAASIASHCSASLSCSAAAQWASSRVLRAQSGPWDGWTQCRELGRQRVAAGGGRLCAPQHLSRRRGPGKLFLTTRPPAAPAPAPPGAGAGQTGSLRGAGRSRRRERRRLPPRRQRPRRAGAARRATAPRHRRAGGWLAAGRRRLQSRAVGAPPAGPWLREADRMQSMRS